MIVGAAFGRPGAVAADLQVRQSAKCTNVLHPVLVSMTYQPRAAGKVGATRQERERMRMNTKLALLAVAGLLVLHTAAPFAQSGYDLLQKALAAERADGNLQQAIELYQRVAREFASDRALAARALVRMADCYTKLGNAQARAIYERVAREYPEQTAAVQEARTHLQAQGPPRSSVRGDRLVWGPAREVDLFGTVSPVY